MTRDNDWIYTNRVPFGLLTADEQAQLKAHDGNYEIFSHVTGWNLHYDPSWVANSTYRAARHALVTDSIDWTHVAPEYKYMVRNCGALDSFIANSKPTLENDDWCFNTDRSCIPASGFASYKRGTVDWRNSLVTRPEGV